MEVRPPYRTLLPPEEALLLICARREIPDSLLLAGTELTTRVNWDRFLHLATEHGVGPLVYASLKRHFATATPEPCMARLRQYTLANAQNNLSMLGELVRTAHLLQSGGIRFAVFKGLVSNQTIYRDLGVRKCGDIDLLVDPKDFARAKALFISEGFAPTLSDSAEIQYLQSGLWHEGRRLNIDLHWGIPPREVGIRADRILDDLSPITIGGVELTTFSREDLFIVLCVNATKEYWNQMLYPYCDIHEFSRSSPGLDWRAVFRRARELRCEGMVNAALRVAAALYEAPELAAAAREQATGGDRITQELLEQLFDDSPAGDGTGSHRRLLRYFRSTDDYFAALIDTRLRKLTYRMIHIPLRRHAPEALGIDDSQISPRLEFLRPAMRASRIGGLLLRRAYQRLRGKD